MALTGKKKAFADAVLSGKTNKAAAILAGYSVATASPAGSRLAKDPEVVAYLAKKRPAAEPPAASVRKGAKAAQDPVAPAPAEVQDGPKFDLAAAMQHTDPKAFLTAAMNDIALDPKQRIIAARALLPFVHGKVADQGKKDGQATAAKKAGAGKFAASAPPLKLVGKR